MASSSSDEGPDGDDDIGAQKPFVDAFMAAKHLRTVSWKLVQAMQFLWDSGHGTNRNPHIWQHPHL